MRESALTSNLHRYDRTQMHREMYIAAINSLHQARGSKLALADKLDITPQYLSYILDPWGSDVPSKRLALRIADTTPLDYIERRELLHHITAARDLVNHYQNPEILDRYQIAQLVRKAEGVQLVATHTSNPSLANEAYRRLLRLSRWALYRINPYHSATNITILLACLHDASNALNNPLNALWYARLSLQLTGADELWQFPFSDHHIWMSINSLRMLSASYHNLSLPKSALDYAIKAKNYTEHYAPPELIQRAAPHLARDQLNAYAISPRFAISDAQAVADWSFDIMDRKDWSSATKCGLAALAQRSLIEAYIQHGSTRSLKKARSLIENSFYSKQLEGLGTLVQTLHIRTQAHLSQKFADFDTSKRHLFQALGIAERAGLLHQQIEIQHDIRVMMQ